MSSFKLSRWPHLIATGFGSGLSPVAPGTVGSLAALPLCWLLSLCSWPYALAAIVGLSLVGIYTSQRTSDDLGVHDHGGIVIDEFAGMAITFFLVPLSLPVIVLGFLLFRLFDIVKPGPVGYLDRTLSGGIGIMADDLLAGLLACLLLHGVVWLFPSLLL